MSVTAIHRTFEKDDSGKRSVTVYASDGAAVKKLTGAKLEKFMAALSGEVRLTAVNGCDPALIQIASRGVTIKYTHWHALGIEAGLPAEEICLKFAQAPEEIFRTFTPRPDLMSLRSIVSLRNALLDCYNRSLLAIKGAGRGAGLLSDAQLSAAPEFKAALDGIKQIKKSIAISEDETPLDTEIKHMAKKIPECVLFNRIAHIKDGWIVAASVMALSGGIDRFHSVSALWKYFGQHVVDGAAPKRKRGIVGNWNPSGRRLMYQLTDSIIKNRKNPWRDFFDEARERELSQHDAKHPGCKTKDGHCTARARRLMCKEILKQFFLAVQGKEQANPRLKPTRLLPAPKIGGRASLVAQSAHATKAGGRRASANQRISASRKNSRQPRMPMSTKQCLADGNGIVNPIAEKHDALWRARGQM